MSIRSRWIAKRKERREKLQAAEAEVRKARAAYDKAQKVIDRHPSPASPRSRALAFARAQVGVKEHPPGSNRGPKIDDWQRAVNMIAQPWCGAFVAACLRAGGVTPSERMRFTPFIIEDAKAGRNGLVRVVPYSERQAGDLFVYQWDSGPVDHVGIYTGNDEGALALVIEGNTAIGDDSNGGQVMVRRRDRKFVAAVCRPRW